MNKEIIFKENGINILSGKAVASKVRSELKKEIADLSASYRPPCLAVILVGDDPASAVYVGMKEKTCAKLGIRSLKFKYPSDMREADLLNKIEELNRDAEVDGILVQLPLPDHIDERKVIEKIDPSKDVDGFHPYNMGRLIAGDPVFVPCTPFGIMRLLKEADVSCKGKKAVVIGRSLIVGKPVASLLLAEHATVTVCHSRTSDLKGEVKSADIVVAAVGRPKMVGGDWIKEGTVVIDVGVNRMEDGSLAGDVDFESVGPKSSLITPVPGGVGPMTIAMLMLNTVKAARMAAGRN